jgi:membrane-bound ClpP family serine protease
MYNLIGLVGVSLIIFTYFLLQINKINSNDLIFSLLNLIGSILIIISLFYKWNLPSFIIEFFWAIISLIGIYKYFKKTE